MTYLRDWFEISALAVEALAVAIMLIVILAGTIRWIAHSARGMKEGYQRYRLTLGKALLVGLELLVGADIIRTVAVEASILNMATLGVLVVVRTFLGWSLTVEVEGRWPWQARRAAQGAPAERE